MRHFLDFEKPLYELEARIDELRNLNEQEDGVNIAEDILKLKEKAERFLNQTYANLTPWQKVLVARHPQRPHTSDYIKALITQFVPLSGDRNRGEDPAILAGLGYFDNQPVCVIGHEKGKGTEERVKKNFGMPSPQGYRKAIRVMTIASRFELPILTFVDTPGADPSVTSEEDGQSQAIAQAIETCLTVDTPIISLISGEGGSGGAIAIAVANTILMLEHAVYSVISPEACASILWRDPTHREVAAETLKMTAQDLKRFDLIDAIVPEPIGGAHRNKQQTYANVKKAIKQALENIKHIPAANLKDHRKRKFIQQTQQFIKD